MTNKQVALTALAEAQNRLTHLLIAEPRDLPAIVEAADAVRRLERRAIAGERDRPVLRVPLFRTPAR